MLLSLFRFQPTPNILNKYSRKYNESEKCYDARFQNGQKSYVMLPVRMTFLDPGAFSERVNNCKSKQLDFAGLFRKCARVFLPCV